MAKPIWQTPAGSLGTVPQGVFYEMPLLAHEPENNATVFYQVIAGDLPPGFSCTEFGLIAGTPTSTEDSYNETSKFAVRAYTRVFESGKAILTSLSDRTFTITVTGAQPPQFITPAGLVAQFYDGTVVRGLEIKHTDIETSKVAIVRGSLPPFLAISDKGIISGYVDPLELDEHQITFDFTLQVSNPSGSSIRSFSIDVYNRVTLTADNTYVTADNTFITADVSAFNPPVMLTPSGSIGTVPGDTFFAFQFVALDPDNQTLRYSWYDPHAGVDPTEPQPGHIYYENTLPPGLTLNPVDGWLMGYLPVAQQSLITYDFKVYAYVENDPYQNTGLIDYSLTLIGQSSSQVTWISPDDLGCIENGSVSRFSIKATRNGPGILAYGSIYDYFPYDTEVFDDLPLVYRLEPGAYSSLPQGLKLLPSGDISGRVSFNTFAFDMGKTTFDIQPWINPALGSCAPCDCTECGNECGGCAACNTCPGVECSETTFDMRHTFTVNVQSLDGEVDAVHVFSILVKRAYNEPYENLYIEAMPPINDRIALNELLKDDAIFPEKYIYRPTDPFFGVAKNVVYWHTYGLTSSTKEKYLEAMEFNHYWKNLTLGEIKTAQALDIDGNVIYEVVYSQVVDTLVNNAGVTVNKEVVLPYPIEVTGFDRRADTTKITADTVLQTADCAPCVIAGPCDPTETIIVYPNGLVDMRKQIVNNIGQISSKLPLWMTSQQTDGTILGFTPAWVIAYTQPGLSGQIAYNLETMMKYPLNRMDFKADRYEIDHCLSINWDPILKRWEPPAKQTTFDGYGWDLPLRFIGEVSYATDLPFIDINDNTVEYINSLGGLDGEITQNLNQKTIIFVKQNNYVNPPNARYPGPISDNLAWTDYVYPYDSSPYSQNLFDEAYIVPGQQAHDRDPLIPNERLGIWRINIGANEVIRLTLEQETTVYDYVNVTYGKTYGQQDLYIPSAPTKGNTVPTWSELPTFKDTPTTFDHNSMLFVQPVDQYDATDNYSQYVLFPKYNIIDDLPSS